MAASAPSDHMPVANDASALPKRLGGGANQSGSRAYNERLALSLIRLNGPLPKAELARLTGLSAQTLSLIMRRLEVDGLVRRLSPVRGRIGQPYVPYELSPTGAYSIGLKIGRRSTELVLCDMVGAVQTRAKLGYPFPQIDEVLKFVRKNVRSMQRRSQHPQRVLGVGIAMPFQIWKWQEELDVPHGSLDAWRDTDVSACIEEATGLSATLVNDATAACASELARSVQSSKLDFLYFYIGSFVGGGVVLNGTLVHGRTGNAGAVGSIPVGPMGQAGQLIHHASLITLERELRRRCLDASLLQQPNEDWSSMGLPLDAWLNGAAQAIAQAAIAGVAVMDFSEVRIDGALPRPVLSRLVAEARKKIAAHDLQGLAPFDIVEGVGGVDARATGAAMLPLLARFASDRDALLKAVPDWAGS